MTALVPYNSENIVAQWIVNTSEHAKCSICDVLLEGNTYIICKFPGDPPSATAEQLEHPHRGHTVCGSCASDSRNYIAEGGYCKACLKVHDVRTRKDAERSKGVAGLGMYPPVLNTLATHLIKDFHEAKNDVEERTNEREKKRINEQQDVRIALAQEKRQKREMVEAQKRALEEVREREARVQEELRLQREAEKKALEEAREREAKIQEELRLQREAEERALEAQKEAEERLEQAAMVLREIQEEKEGMEEQHEQMRDVIGELTDEASEAKSRAAAMQRQLEERQQEERQQEERQLQEEEEPVTRKGKKPGQAKGSKSSARPATYYNYSSNVLAQNTKAIRKAQLQNYEDLEHNATEWRTLYDKLFNLASSMLEDSGGDVDRFSILAGQERALHPIRKLKVVPAKLVQGQRHLEGQGLEEEEVLDAEE